MLNRLRSVTAASALGAGVLFAFLTIPAAFGADFLKADVPFTFQVGSKTLPPGSYEFTIHRNGQFVSVLGSTREKRSEAIGNIITMLGPVSHGTATDSHLVFDKVGGRYILSELWEPKSEGILVHVE